MPINEQQPDSQFTLLLTQLAGAFSNSGHRLVLAESCTSGLVAANLARIPGISQYFCGSFVTYRDQSKISWLGISAETVKNFTAVSQETTDRMATRALALTEEADFGFAVTGHLGPLGNNPSSRDRQNLGRCFTSIALRTGQQISVLPQEPMQLVAQERYERQLEVTQRCLELILHHLSSNPKF